MSRMFMTFPEFYSRVKTHSSPTLSKFGFVWEIDAYFTRPRNQWQDVLCFGLNHVTGCTFCGQYGIHVPELEHRFTSLDEGTSAVLPLPCVGDDMLQQKWYSFSDTRSVEDACDELLQDFQRYTLPWYMKFQSLGDIASLYYQANVDWDWWLPTIPHDPVAWASYGFLLQLCGDDRRARTWLRRAYELAGKPVRRKRGWFKKTEYVLPSERDEKLRKIVQESGLLNT